MKAVAQQSDNQVIKSCVVYYRVSRSHQKDQRQESDCIRYCKDNGYQIVQTFREKISGRKRAREAMTNCLNYLNDNNIHYLVCSELSRLGRTLEVSTMLDELTQKRICIIAIKEDLQTLNDDLTKNDKHLSLALFAISNAIKESEYISYRVKSGRNERVVNNGSWTGGKYLPYGYTSIDKKLVIEPQEAEWVKQIFEKYLSGWGAIKITNWLNMQNICTKLGLKWDRATINQMLHHTIYIGQRNWRGSTLDTPDLRIVSDDIFYAVKKRKHERKNPDHTFNKLKKYTYLFDRGIMVCGVCGKKFSGLGGLNKYSCDSGKYTRCCGCESIKMDWLELNIQNYLATNEVKLIHNNTLAIQQNEQMEIDLKLLQEDLRKKQAQLDRYNEIYSLNRMTRSAYDLKYTETSEQITKVNESIEQVRKELLSIKPILGRVIIKRKFELNEETQHYDGKNYEINKETLHKVIKRITVNKRTKTGQLIDVNLVNGNEFQLNFIPSRMTILKPIE